MYLGEVGKGTAFTIHLPCSEETVRTKHIDELVVTGVGTILLVDDEEVIRISEKLLLEEMGYNVITAENGKE